MRISKITCVSCEAKLELKPEEEDCPECGEALDRCRGCGGNEYEYNEDAEFEYCKSCSLVVGDDPDEAPIGTEAR